MKKLYLISSGVDNKIYKIGYTRRDVKKRIKEFKTGNSTLLEIVYTFESKWSSKIEPLLHKKYEKIEGEWFKLTNDEINSFIKTCEHLHNTFEVLSTENTWVIDKSIL